MTYKKSNIYIFSGTGNSLLIAREIARVFNENGIETELHPLDSKTKAQPNHNSLLGLVFPVAMQGTYQFIWRFVENLPEGNGRPVFMADTLGIFSGGIVGPMKKILKRKGYRCVGAKEFRMPHNLLKQHPSEIKSEQKRKKSLLKAKKYAVNILKGQTRWKRIPLVSDINSVISRGKGWWKLYRALFKIKVDADACIACDLCVRLCPVDNFKLTEIQTTKGTRKFSQPADKCELCMRCVTFCPKGAITLAGKRAFYKAVSSGDLLREE